MPLQSGNWVANINGNVTPLQIIGVDSRGVVVCSISGTRFSGFWDEDAQKLTLNLPVVQGTSAEVYTGYLFTDPINLTGVAGSVIFTLVGSVECFTVGSPFVAATAKRSVFGWYAQIGVD